MARVLKWSHSFTWTPRVAAFIR